MKIKDEISGLMDDWHAHARRRGGALGRDGNCAELQCPPLPWLLLLEYRVALLPGHLNFPHHGLCTAFWGILPHPCAACLAACRIQLCPAREERKIWPSWASLLVPLGCAGATGVPCPGQQ